MAILNIVHRQHEIAACLLVESHRANLATIVAMMRSRRRCATCRTAAEPTQPVDFTRDVRPILADNCFHCHGPDAAERQADLRLDVWQTTGDIRGAEACDRRAASRTRAS